MCFSEDDRSVDGGIRFCSPKLHCDLSVAFLVDHRLRDAEFAIR